MGDEQHGRECEQEPAHGAFASLAAAAFTRSRCKSSGGAASSSAAASSSSGEQVVMQMQDHQALDVVTAFQLQGDAVVVGLHLVSGAAASPVAAGSMTVLDLDQPSGGQMPATR
jgi:hypothetical protein